MYPPTDRTTATRMRDRMSYDEAAAHAVLDEAYHCALGFTVDGEPRVLPTLHVRVGDTLYLHGSTGSRPLLAARGDAGLPVCVTVTLLDGLVFARSQFNHSANYRSVVVHGTARLVTDEREKAEVLTALVEKVATGRSTDSRPPSRRELAETAVLALPLREVSVRARAAGANDDPADLDLPYWAGVVPLRLTAGVPEPAAGVTAPVPAYLRPARSAWLEPVVLRGEHVVLEPLDLSHAEELYAALDDEEVWRYVGSPRPRTVDETAGQIRAALDANRRGVRTPWVQRCAATGAVVGTTSYYHPDADLRTAEIGFTQLGRPWWRTGINTEAKLLLLTRAFEELDAIRVTWQTSTLNERSQRAIERLGATREGTLRSNRRRSDGTWRDSALYSMLAAEWPNAQARLRERLRPAAPVAS
ncbi:bifunctional pyridoxamine 5'-phosphate oxidase family protein/GNAT family N-acetyltransferase [Micromonospora sp. DR5-3]|uniref:bifunctional pyridoxamine 5'-phosphate oxidase family protein/GNAT family N-acetyltransferase n=1 Tax=unclassified Micromonospora TaxID=2617518 RepID=UPI0011D3C875|nr:MULTISPECIES: bifunctional pyridoxamine 5'-phosphate oxidase family protein/GNAT family N-acetyltransferase [unclassified Micromonospora]MCW3813381.1 bifunctional pyridoxamine 5'-phosphate oxidase family protein/GNAT family N-acetyltransferase [Micromonospora sp. DR5-3]TYC24763.1 GNAT family N-acetyltransferase [Micromonospora sp. MP36]